MTAVDSFKEIYAYQFHVRCNPIIEAWFSRVASALEAMQGVEVEFATSLTERSEENKPYHDHDNQLVEVFLAPVLSSVEGAEQTDEECLPFYRVRFADGVEIWADDAELFSHDSRLLDLFSAVSGAFACARELGYVGPWALVAEGSDAERARFVERFESWRTTTDHWDHNHNTPARFRNVSEA